MDDAVSALEEEAERYFNSLTEEQKKEVKRMLAEFELLNKLVSYENHNEK